MAETINDDKTGKTADRLLLKYLLSSVREGVIFLDNEYTILAWNKATERITGSNSEQMLGKTWSPTLLGMKTRSGSFIDDDHCPIRDAVTEKSESHSTVFLQNEVGDQVPVELHAITIEFDSEIRLGSLILLHDASSKINYQQQLQTLEARATSDPLTGIANRSEFERMLTTCISNRETTKVDFSLVICDIDFFKKINDDFGHNIGDEALKSFAELLSSNIRQEDFVARYGGEEFVILCVDCDQESAVERAECLRNKMENTPIAALAGKSLTASFGVAELNDGDCPESFFVRADQALLQAKEQGRNCVAIGEVGVSGQIKVRLNESDTIGDWKKVGGKKILQREFISASPDELLFQKIKGMVEEQKYKIISVKPNHLVVRSESDIQLFRRKSDQRATLLVDIQLTQIEDPDPEMARRCSSFTRLQITISPATRRNRRTEVLNAQAEFLLNEIRRFLMLDETEETVDRAATSSGRE